MQKFHRELSDYLRQEYHVNNIRIERGGRHPKLCFAYKGQTFSVPTNSSSDSNGKHSAIRELQSLLGAPPAKPAKQSRRLEEMMRSLHSSTAAIPHAKLDSEAIADAVENAMYPPPPITVGPAAAPPPTDPLSFDPAPAPVPPPAPPAKVWPVRVAAYRSGADARGAVMQFVFDKAVAANYDCVVIEQLDPENWKIVKTGKSRWRFTPFNDSGSKVILKVMIPGLLAFTATDTEAVEANGEILVHLPLAGRRAPAVKYTAETVETVAVATRPFVATVTESTLDSMETRMRAVLLEARAIEAACPYRLIRGDGRLAWTAPVIE